MSCRIVVARDGALRVEGEFEVVDEAGKPYGLGGRRKVVLCRCGHSGNAPFCDAAHKRLGFQGPSAAFDLPPVPKP
jgi:CDGSH-type Zn-finger protein